MTQDYLQRKPNTADTRATITRTTVYSIVFNHEPDWIPEPNARLAEGASFARTYIRGRTQCAIYQVLSNPRCAEHGTPERAKAAERVQVAESSVHAAREVAADWMAYAPSRRLCTCQYTPITHGFAYCSNREEYNIAKGCETALNRVLRRSKFPRNERTILWAQYWTTKAEQDAARAGRNKTSITLEQPPLLP